MREFRIHVGEWRGGEAQRAHVMPLVPGGPQTARAAYDIDAGAGDVEVSAVIPVRDEEDGLDALHCELTRVLSGPGYRYQLIFVDDCSTDGSWRRLKALQRGCARTLCIGLRHHVGQQQALLAGLRFAKGRAVVTYDADMQFDPACVPQLAAEIHRGCDIAGGIRTPRSHGWWNSRIPSRLGRHLINHALQIEQQDFGAVKAYSRRLVADILRNSHGQTIIPALAYALSRNWIEIPVAYRPRATGQSKWDLSKRIQLYLQIHANHGQGALAALLGRTMRHMCGGGEVGEPDELIAIILGGDDASGCVSRGDANAE